MKNHRVEIRQPFIEFAAVEVIAASRPFEQD
jgi:hypothetical protein